MILDNAYQSKNKENMEMISLYDYLGRAAGPDLGKTVATAAAKAGIKSEIREVSHVGYRGPIMLYPRTFLDNFFGGGLNESTSGKQYVNNSADYDSIRRDFKYTCVFSFYCS